MKIKTSTLYISSKDEEEQLMIIADSHVHSEFSSDSQTPMEQMIEKAIRKPEVVEAVQKGEIVTASIQGTGEKRKALDRYRRMIQGK